MNNVGRPKKEGLAKVVKVTVDDEMAEMLDSTVKETGKTKSDILRSLIPIISSKDFEGLIPDDNMDILQSYSEKCWDILHTPDCVFEAENLSERMPAFITNWNPPMVYVKYPTYKIQVFDGKNSKHTNDEREIEKLLENVQNRSVVYASKVDSIIIGNRLREMENPFISEVMCLDVTLAGNICCKNKIAEILKANNYSISVFPAYCIRGMVVELLENGKYFKVLPIKEIN